MRNTLKRWYDGLCGELRRSRSRPLRQVFARPGLEALEDRVVPTTDTWIASGSSADWSVGSNWSLGASPSAGQDVVFQVNGSQGTAACTVEVSTPLLASVTFASNWTQMLMLTSQGSGQQQTFGILNADTITLNARTGSPSTPYSIGVNASSCAVNCYQDMEFKGGGIGGMGTLQLTGTLNVGGTSSTDEPTLGIALNLGDGTTTTTMEYNSNTVPLVLRDNGNITVEANATLDFSGAASGTAIAAGDGSSHTLTIDGGTVQTNGTAEEDVAMGVVENSGTMTINGPFVLTGFNADSFGLDVTGGTTELRKDASFSGGANVYNGGWLIIDQNVNASFGGSMVVSGGGTVSTSGNLTCTGQVTVKGGMAGNGKLNLSGSLDAQGGVILMDKGIITTQSSTGATISMGSSSVFQMQGGILYVTPQTSGNGTLTVYGSMSISGGDVWINCDSTHNTSGFLYVTGVLTLTNGNTATLHCKDVDYNNVGMNYGAIYCDADGGGNFAVGDLPPTGGGGWFDNNRSFRAWS